jgi:RNA polymerase sigma factor (sigma-70 family)
VELQLPAEISFTVAPLEDILDSSRAIRGNTALEADDSWAGTFIALGDGSKRYRSGHEITCLNGREESDQRTNHREKHCFHIIAFSNGVPNLSLQGSVIFSVLASSFCPAKTGRVSSLPIPAERRDEPFVSTHWSVVFGAGQSESDPERARVALEELCRTYWPPLYTFVRTRGYSVEDAQDLTQSFFVHLIEHEIYARAQRAKGKFRSFLLAALKNFLADAYTHAHRLKRGGAEVFLPLDEARAEAAESLFQTHFANAEPNSDDRLFERSWAEALLGAGLQRLSAEYQSQGKQSLFQQLRVFLTGGREPVPAYDQLATKIGLPASTLRSHVTRLRKRYRELIRAEVRQTVGSEAEVDAELRELFRVLAG